MANPNRDTVRGAIVVIGTEVLSGRVRDANGPWLGAQLRDAGVRVTKIVIVGDRADDLRTALDTLAADDIDVIVTSGGTGPTEDDLTVDVVAGFAGRGLMVDPDLHERIRMTELRERTGREPWDDNALDAGSAKQARVPEGATALEPVGTAPGLVIPPAEGAPGPVVVVLPGPPNELQPMWSKARGTALLRAVLARTSPPERRVVRLLGLESELAHSLAAIRAEDHVPIERLEVGTYTDGTGQLEVATVFDPAEAAGYAAFEAALVRRWGDAVFSLDGSTVEKIVASQLEGRTIAVAEWGTEGLLRARLAEHIDSGRLTSSMTVCTNDDLTEVLGVRSWHISSHGVISQAVTTTAAYEWMYRSSADIGIAVSPISGFGVQPTDRAPAGTVRAAVVHRGRPPVERTMHWPHTLPWARRCTITEVLHMLRLALRQPATEGFGHG